MARRLRAPQRLVPTGHPTRADRGGHRHVGGVRRARLPARVPPQGRAPPAPPPGDRRAAPGPPHPVSPRDREAVRLRQGARARAAGEERDPEGDRHRDPVGPADPPRR